MKRIIWILSIGAALLALYGAGFIYFLNKVNFSASASKDTVQTDGLVVFTGSHGRVPFGLFQLVKGFDGPLLITGVNPAAKLEDLTGADALEPMHKLRITLDYSAQTTRDNVDVTIKWAKQNGLKNVALITAPFHVPRSLLLFKQKQSNLEVEPYPPQPQEASWAILLREYTKLLGVYAMMPFHGYNASS